MESDHPGSSYLLRDNEFNPVSNSLRSRGGIPAELQIPLVVITSLQNAGLLGNWYGLATLPWYNRYKLDLGQGFYPDLERLQKFAQCLALFSNYDVHF